MMKYRLLAALLVFGPAVCTLTAQIPFRTNEGYQLVDIQTKKPLNSLFFDEAEIIGENTVLVQRGERKGVLGAGGSFVIRAEYPVLYKLGSYYVFGEVKNGPLGIMDSTGNVTAAPAFDRIEAGNGKLFLAQIGGDWGKWGVIDASGKWIEKPVHESMSMDMRPFPSLAVIGPHHIVCKSGTSGFYNLKDLQTSKIVAIRHDSAFLPWFEDGVAAVYGDEGSYLVKYDGTILIPETRGEIMQSGPYAFSFGRNQTKVYTRKGKLIKTFEAFTRGEGDTDYMVLARDFYYLLTDEKGKSMRRSSLPIQLMGSGYYVYYETENQQILASREGKTMPVPENYKVKNYNAANGLAILENGKGYQSVYDFNAGRFTAEGFYGISPLKGDLFVAEFSAYSKTVVNGKTGEQFSKFRPEYKVTEWAGKFSIEDGITRRYIYKDTFNHAVVSNLYDSLFIVRIRQDIFLLNAAQRKMSAPYSNISAAGKHFKVCVGGKCGLMNAEMQEVIPPVMGQLSELRIGKGSFYKIGSNRYGIADERGKIILDTVYNLIEDRGNVIAFRNEKGYGFLDSAGKRIAGLEGMYNFSPVGVDWISFSLPGKTALLYVPAEKIVDLPKDHYYVKMMQIDGASDHFVIRKDYKYGLMDQSGKMVIPAKYGSVSSDQSPVRFFSSENGAMVLTGRDGNLDIRQTNELISLRDRYLTEVMTIEARYALKDKAGNYVMTNEKLLPVDNTSYADLFSGVNFFIAKDLSGKYGALYDDGKQVIPFIYDAYDESVWQFDAFKKGKDYFLYDISGNRVFENLHITGIDNQLSDYSNAYMVMKMADGTQSIVAIDGGKVILDQIISLDIDEETFYAVSYGETASVMVQMKSGKGIFSLNSLKFLVEPVYDDMDFYSYYPTESYLLKTRKNGKYNLFDLRTCKKLFDQDVDVIYSLSAHDEVQKALCGNVLYLVAGYYDEPDMNVIQIDPLYKKAELSYDYDLIYSGFPVIVVKMGKKKGLLKLDGNWLHKPELDRYEYPIDDWHMLVTKNKLVYILNINDGTYLCQQGFDVIEPTGEYEGEYAIGYLNGKEYSITAKGQVSERKEQ